MIDLGAFGLEEPIGSGGMATVWQGAHRREGVPVAIKVLRASDRWKTDGKEQFRTEVRAAASLHHPAVVLVLDHGEVDAMAAAASSGRLTEGDPYLVMELCRGGTLSDHRGALPWPRLRPVLMALLDALAHAHARGVIHRDLKPANVLLSGPDDLRPGIKLSDFGIARVFDPTAEAGSDEAPFAGSPAYCPPEQLVGPARDIGPHSDLYALGCLAWALLCGDPPHARMGLAHLAASRLAGRFPDFEPFDPVPGPVVDWLMRLLSTRPRDRFATAADAAWALRQAAPEEQDEPLPEDVLPAVGGQERHTATRLLSQRPADGLTLVETPEAQATRLELTALARTASWTTLERESVPGASAAPAVSALPPIPDDWRRPDPPPGPMKLVGAGLGLYAFRTVPLVGREEARDQVWGALHDVVRDGLARCVVVRGPAGVGKSRLAGWMAERAEELGVATILRVVHGSLAGPADGLRPALRRHLRAEGSAGGGLVVRVRDWLDARGARDRYLESAIVELIAPGTAGDDDRSMRLDLASARHRWQAWAATIGVEAARRPVLLWLDDVQWGADALGLALRLVEKRALDRRPVLVVATVRDEGLAVGSAEEQRLERLLAMEGCQELPLRPLARRLHRELVSELLRLDAELAEEVAERTGGNPLFALQLVGDWIRRGVLVVGEQGFERAEGADASIPDDIHLLWTARFDAALAEIAEPYRDAIDVAAALGSEFAPEDWYAAASIDPFEGAIVSGALLEKGLWSTVGAALRFAHGMARESVERRAREADRWRDAHASCAAALVAATDLDSIERRGRHRLEADHPFEAIVDLRAAVSGRRERGETTAALRNARLLLEAMDGADIAELDERRLMVRLDLLTLGRLSGAEADEAGPRDVLEAARRAGLAHVEALALCELGLRLRDAGQLAEGTEQLGEALNLAEMIANDQATARASQSLAWALVMGGDRETARRLFRRAAEVHGRLGDLGGMAVSYMGLCEAYSQSRQLDRAEHFGRRALEAAETRGDPSRIGDACVHLATVEIARRRLEDATQLLDRSRECFERVGNHTRISSTLNLSGEVARHRGDHEAAAEAYRESLAIQQVTAPGWTWLPRINLAVLAMEGGRFAQARIPLDRARAQLAAAGRVEQVEWVDILLLPVLLTVGDEEAFEACLQRVEAVAPDWKRVERDCLRALDWAPPIARRAGADRTAGRLAGLARVYREKLEG